MFLPVKKGKVFTDREREREWRRECQNKHNISMTTEKKNRNNLYYQEYFFLENILLKCEHCECDEVREPRGES